VNISYSAAFAPSRATYRLLSFAFQYFPRVFPGKNRKVFAANFSN